MSQSGTAYSRSQLARFSRERFVLRIYENFRKKKMSQSKEILPLGSITRFVRSAKRERRSAIKF